MTLNFLHWMSTLEGVLPHTATFIAKCAMRIDISTAMGMTRAPHVSRKENRRISALAVNFDHEIQRRKKKKDRRRRDRRGMDV